MYQRITPVKATDLRLAVQASEIRICGQYGRGIHAEIVYLPGSQEYRVYDQRKEIITTAIAEMAAMVYNEIRPHNGED